MIAASLAVSILADAGVTLVRRYIDEFMADTTIDNIIRALTPSSQKLKERSAARALRAHVRASCHVTP